MRTILASLLALVSGGVFAAGATLIDSTDYVPEKSATAAEAQQIAAARGALRTSSVHLVKINMAALGSGVVTIVTPDGKRRDFTGTTTRQPGLMVMTEGKPPTRAPETVRWEGVEAVTPSENYTPAKAMFSTDGETVIGGVSFEGRSFGYAGSAARGANILASETLPAAPIPPGTDVRDVVNPKPAASAPSKSTIQMMRPMGTNDGLPIKVLVVWTPATIALANSNGYTTPTARANFAGVLLTHVNNTLNQPASDGNSHIRFNIAAIASFDSTNANYGASSTDALRVGRYDVPTIKARDFNSVDMVLILHSGTADDFGMGLAQVTGAVVPRDAFAAVPFSEAKITVESGTSIVTHHTIGHIFGATHQPTSGAVGNTAGGQGYMARRIGPDGIARCYHTLDSFAMNGFAQAPPTCGGTTGAPPITVSSVDNVIYAWSSSIPLTAGCTTFETHCILGDLSHDNAATMRGFYGYVSTFGNKPLLQATVAPEVAVIFAALD